MQDLENGADVFAFADDQLNSTLLINHKAKVPVRMH